VTFRSKVDAWFIGAALVTAAAAAFAWQVSLAEESLIGVFLSPLPLVLVAWIWVSTRYTITDEELLVRCAFVRIAVPLPSITHMRRTATVLSAPALSLDRIEVQHTAGSVVISPRDLTGFVHALAARCPAVAADLPRAAGGEDDARLRRIRRYAALALLPVPLGAMLLGVALTLWPAAPPRIAAGEAGVIVESGGSTLTVPYGAMTSVTLEERLPELRKRSGRNSFATLRGRFMAGGTEAFVDVARRTPPYILMRTADGLVIVNLPDPQRTRAVYDSIVSRRGQTYTDETAR
jgi:hypothetical protein